jgi:uncharacterized protein
VVTAPQPFTRHDVSFASGDSTCAAWLYLPTGVTSPPVVVLGHGVGGTREMRMDAYAERFAQVGIAASAFTYRHFGDSGGQPRQLMSISRQLADWEAALAYVRAHPRQVRRAGRAARRRPSRSVLPEPQCRPPSEDELP